MKAPPQTHTHTQQATRTNTGGVGSGGGGSLAGLRLERLGSIPGSSRICSRGRQVGLSFPSGPIPGEGVKVTAAVQPESLRAGVRTRSGPQGALTDRPPLLHAERKSRRYRTSDPDSKARIYLQGPQTSGLPGPPEPRVGARPGRLDMERGEKGMPSASGPDPRPVTAYSPGPQRASSGARPSPEAGTVTPASDGPATFPRPGTHSPGLRSPSVGPAARRPVQMRPGSGSGVGSAGGVSRP